MSTPIYYEEMGLDIDDALRLKCKCGHKLSYHGFVVFPSFLLPHQGNYLSVSQCVMCPIEDGKFTCSAFELRAK